VLRGVLCDAFLVEPNNTTPLLLLLLLLLLSW